MQKIFSFYKSPHRYTYGLLTVSIFIIFLISTSHITHEEFESLNCEDRGKNFQGVKSNSTANGYELIHIISHPNRTGDINLTLCWIVDEQIQVGKLITLDAKANSERYMENNSSHKITISIPNDHINYWVDSNKSYIRQHMYEMSNKLVLTQKNSKIFESEPINFRFTVPNPISITYCEYFPNEECFSVENLLQPASYYLDQELNLTRQTVVLAKITEDLTNDIIELTCFNIYLNIILVFFTGTVLIYTIMNILTKDNLVKKRIHIPIIVVMFFIIISVIFKFTTYDQCVDNFAIWPF